MKIELKEITIKDVSKGYINDNEEGVVGYGGKLNIRPKYQREFVYKDKQRDSVIETVRKERWSDYQPSIALHESKEGSSQQLNAH